MDNSLKGSIPVREQKLLVADDEPAVLRMLDIALKLPHRLVRTVDGGQAALHLAREWRPDLLLIDVLMPDIDGYEVCQRSREFTTAPIILLTALRSSDGLKRGLGYGADAYITKPFSLAELRARVGFLLEQGQRLCWPGISSSEATSDNTPERLSFERGRLVIDFVKRLAYRGDIVLPLSNSQFRLLAVLALKQQEPIENSVLEQMLWGDEGQQSQSLLLYQIGLLSSKLGDSEERSRYFDRSDPDKLCFIAKPGD